MVRMAKMADREATRRQCEYEWRSDQEAILCSR